MCRYADLSKGKCKASNDICPYLYFCSKIQGYKESKRMPDNCKVKEDFERPEDSYVVAYGKKNMLYVEVNGVIVIVENPYNFVPAYIKLAEEGGDWKAIS